MSPHIILVLLVSAFLMWITYIYLCFRILQSIDITDKQIQKKYIQAKMQYRQKLRQEPKHNKEKLT